MPRLKRKCNTPDKNSALYQIAQSLPKIPDAAAFGIFTSYLDRPAIPEQDAEVKKSPGRAIFRKALKNYVYRATLNKIPRLSICIEPKIERKRPGAEREDKTMRHTKIACLLALLLALALLAACADEAAEPAPTGVPEETQSPEETPEESNAPEESGTETPNEPDGSERTTPETPDAPEEPENAFTFTRENFPVMDGSTSMVPLGQAVASVLLGESREDVADLAQFNRTTQSFRNLKDGLCDILIVGQPNAVVFDEMEEAGFEYELETIATDALIFVVNEGNPVDDLTTDQIRAIYTGEITNWAEVGGLDEPIVPFQRNEGAGSQALMVKLVMGDTPLMEAPAEYIATAMGELMEVVRSYDNSASAIGYSVYYYANDMRMAEGLKILSVDGVAPSAETIRSGEYPHLNAYYSVIASDEPADSPARILYDWLMTEEGQRLVAAEGYVSVMEFDE